MGSKTAAPMHLKMSGSEMGWAWCVGVATSSLLRLGRVGVGLRRVVEDIVAAMLRSAHDWMRTCVSDQGLSVYLPVGPCISMSVSGAGVVVLGEAEAKWTHWM